MKLSRIWLASVSGHWSQNSTKLLLLGPDDVNIEPSFCSCYSALSAAVGKMKLAVLMS